MGHRHGGFRETSRGQANSLAKRNLDERDPFTPADENGHHLSRSLLEPDVCVRRGSGGPAPRPESNFRKNSPAPNERTIESLPNGDADLKNRSQLGARLPTELRNELSIPRWRLFRGADI